MNSAVQMINVTQYTNAESTNIRIVLCSAVCLRFLLFRLRLALVLWLSFLVAMVFSSSDTLGGAVFAEGACECTAAVDEFADFSSFGSEDIVLTEGNDGASIKTEGVLCSRLTPRSTEYILHIIKPTQNVDQPISC
jgi:hypothetical protein